MPPVVPIVAGFAATATAVSAGVVVAGGFGAAAIGAGTSLAVGALMNSGKKRTDQRIIDNPLLPIFPNGMPANTTTSPSISAPSMVTQNPDSDIRNTIRSGISPQNLIYGKALVGGIIPWWFISGERQQYHHFAQVLAGHTIEGIESFYINTEQVEVDAEGFVTTPKYTRDGQRLIRFAVFDGDQTNLPNEVVVASAGALNGADCASGIAWVYVRWEADYDVFGQIGIPEFRFVVKGKKLFDPRTNTTYYSNNPALIARDYLTSSMGLRCLASEINNADVIASANICDENVLTPSGATQKRYSINGALSTENNLKGNLELISFAMSGMLFWSQGQWSIQAGAYQTPVATINENKIIDIENLAAFPSRRDIFNSITGTFIAANDMYVEKQFPVVSNSDFMALDGEQIERNINYPLITDATIAQRLAKIDIMRARQAVTISMTCNYKAYDLRPGSHVYISIARYGWVNKVFYVFERTLTESGIHYTFRETSSAVWDWTQFEAQEVDPAPNTNLPNPFIVPTVKNLTAKSGTNYLYVASDGTVISRIKCAWTASNSQYIYSGGSIELQYTTGTNDWVSARVDGDQSIAFLAPVTDKLVYKIRARFINNTGQRGAWTQINHTVIGKSEPPPNVTSFTIEKNVASWGSIQNTPDLAGYKIRFQYGQNSWWNTATPLHSGLLTESPHAFESLPNGPITLLIKAIDTSGNESLQPAVITQNLGDVIVNNLLFEYPQHPLWLGEKTNATVIAGELVANDTSLFYQADDLPMYDYETDLFYPVIQSLSMIYEFEVVAIKDSFLKLNYLFDASSFKIEYSLPSQSLFYALDDQLMYGDDANLFYGPYTDFMPWIGQYFAIDTTEVKFKITTTGGATVDRLLELTALIDVEDIVIRLDDVVILSTGTRLNLGRVVNAVKNVQITVQADGNNGINARVIDKGASNGPLVEVLNSSGVAVNGLIDAVIQAY